MSLAYWHADNADVSQRRFSQIIFGDFLKLLKENYVRFYDKLNQ
jgi:hypothetical protein